MSSGVLHASVRARTPRAPPGRRDLLPHLHADDMAGVGEVLLARARAARRDRKPMPRIDRRPTMSAIAPCWRFAAADVQLGCPAPMGCGEPTGGGSDPMGCGNASGPWRQHGLRRFCGRQESGGRDKQGPAHKGPMSLMKMLLEALEKDDHKKTVAVLKLVMDKKKR